MTYHETGEAPPQTDMIRMPSQMLDAHPPHITDFGLPYRDKTGVIMTKIRLVSSGGCNEEVVEGFGGGGVGQGAAGAGVELVGDGVELVLGVG
jgi:hypothetical protein